MKRKKLDIVMIVPGMKFDGDSLDKHSLGGSETAALCMARELAAAGNDVIMFNNNSGQAVHDRVTYAPIEMARTFLATVPCDVVISQREPGIFGTQNTGKLNVLWQHDLPLIRQAGPFKSTLWNVDLVMTVSKFMTDKYKKVYDLPDELMWTTRNGIDLERIKHPDGSATVKRNKKRLVYAARPERGLDVLLGSIMPKLLERDPDFELVVAGYDNTVPDMQAFYGSIHKMIDEFKGRVKWAGHLTKDQLYDLYQTCGAYVYPTPSPMGVNFSEVSCISAMEAQACGLPWISSDKGALSETVAPNAGILIPGNPWKEKARETFIESIIRVATNDQVWHTMSDAGKMRARHLSWKALAEEWSDQFCEEIAKRNADPVRLVKHFIRHSDIGAAHGVLQNEFKDEVNKENKELVELAKRLSNEWGFSTEMYGGPDHRKVFASHYEEMGKITDERLTMQFERGDFKEEHFERTNEKRFHLIEEFLKSRDDINSVIDYGCGHGWHDIYMERKVGKEWTGIDVDPGAIKWSEKFRDLYAKHPENLKFIQGDHNAMSERNHNTEPADCLIMSEVLEHCVDPIETVEALEKSVKKGMPVFITVPYGPREYAEFENIKHRNHIHELDLRSLKEMFGDKPGIDIICVFETMVEELNEPAGFIVVTYNADHKPLGKIDWERKLHLQRPRQTVSASMICGPNTEQTLRWCLAPLKHLVDEIIIGDCGMNDEAKTIAKDMGAIIVDAPDPKTAGFDEARNATLPHCKSDWILWIDSDERITDPAQILKYIRENMFHGYSLKQHHFTVDTGFKPDIPVRMFRNRPWNGKPVRFFGSVHEHPEVGINEGPGHSLIIGDAHIAHIGYLAESGRKKKFFRNNPLLQMSDKKYPERLLNKHFIMRDLDLLNGYEMKENGQQITSAIIERARMIVKLCQEHIIGKGSYLSGDSLAYYSTANRLLNQGFEAAIAFNCQKEGQPVIPQVPVIRFACKEDLEKEMAVQISGMVDPLMSEDY